MPKEKYCGINKVPANMERGDAEYCLKHNQVRYWGLKKVDSSILEELKNIKDLEKLEKELKSAFILLRALNKKAEKIIKDLDTYESEKYLKKRLEIFDTEQEKKVEKKRIKKRTEELKELARKQANKIKNHRKLIQTLENNIEELKED